MDINTDSRRKRNVIQVKSETEYSQPTSQQSITPCTKEVGTESCIDVDHVYTICEIYSIAELPPCFRPNARTQPKHGETIPEYYEGQCIILRAYRCKGVNTIEKPKYGSQDSSCTCISGIDEREFDELSQNSGQKFEGENVCTFNLVTNVPQRIADTARCKDSCPNLLITQGIQTEVDVRKSKKPKEQGDRTPPVMFRPQQKFNASENQASLTTIKETEEEHESYPSVEEKSKSGAACDTVAYPMYTDAERRLRQTKSNLCNVASLLETNMINECRVICSRSNFCYKPRLRDSYTSCTNFAQPLTSHCTVQRNAVRNNATLGYRVSERQISCGPYECQSDRCFDRKNRLSRVESSSLSNQHELCASKSRQRPSTFQESFTNRHNGINNTHGYSIAGGRFGNCMPNRWYRDNTYGNYNAFGRHCACNNGYNIGNTHYASTASWMGYYAPCSYYSSFNGWY